MNLVMTRSKAIIASSIALTLALAGCGGGGSQSGAAASAPQVAAAPAPGPSPTPIPSPTFLPVIVVAGAEPGQSLEALLACARNPATQNADGRAIGLASLSGAKIDNSAAIAYSAADTSQFDVNGFGGAGFAPADKHPSPTAAYDHFLTRLGDELYIFRNGSAGSLLFATLGLYNEAEGLCFFAAGLRPPSLPSGAPGDYFARADGIAMIGGQPSRLFGTHGTLDIDFSTGAATFRLDLVGRGDPFGEFLDRPSAPIATVTAPLQLRNGESFFSDRLAGGGYTGTVIGRLVSNSRNTGGTGGAGAIFVFELSDAQGNVIFGAVAAERNLI